MANQIFLLGAGDFCVATFGQQASETESQLNRREGRHAAPTKGKGGAGQLTGASSMKSIKKVTP